MHFQIALTPEHVTGFGSVSFSKRGEYTDEKRRRRRKKNQW